MKELQIHDLIEPISAPSEVMIFLFISQECEKVCIYCLQLVAPFQ